MFAYFWILLGIMGIFEYFCVSFGTFWFFYELVLVDFAHLYYIFASKAFFPANVILLKELTVLFTKRIFANCVV